MNWRFTAGILILYYDKETNFTHALLITQSNAISSNVDEEIKTGKVDWADPSMIPLTLLHQVLTFVIRVFKAVQYDIQKVNGTTGHYNYKNREDVDAMMADSIQIDFMSTSRTLNECGQLASTSTSCFSSLLRAIEQLQLFRSQIEFSEQSSKPQEDTSMLDERINILTEECHALYLEAQAAEKQSSVLMQVVSLKSNLSTYLFLQGEEEKSATVPC